MRLRVGEVAVRQQLFGDVREQVGDARAVGRARAAGEDRDGIAVVIDEPGRVEVGCRIAGVLVVPALLDRGPAGGSRDAEELVGAVGGACCRVPHGVEQPRPHARVTRQLGVQAHQRGRPDSGVAPPAGAARRLAEPGQVEALLDPVDQRVATDPAVEGGRDRVVRLGDHRVRLRPGATDQLTAEQQPGGDEDLHDRLSFEQAAVGARTVEATGPGIEHGDADGVAVRPRIAGAVLHHRGPGLRARRRGQRDRHDGNGNGDEHAHTGSLGRINAQCAPVLGQPAANMPQKRWLALPAGRPAV